MARYELATHRLFIDAPLEVGERIPLEPDAFNRLAHVLRMGDGARLLVFNGQQGEFEAQFRMTGKKSAALEVVTLVRAQTGQGRIHLAFAPLKAARLDYMVQKAVEMGAASLQPVRTRRTQISGLRREKLLAHAIEAAEQCGILALPEIRPETALDSFLATREVNNTLAFFDEGAEPGDPVAALRKAAIPGALSLLIGPEGGFEEAERVMISREKSVIRLSLGPRILRADTAAVAALTVAQVAMGDIG
jgi:16S rRNA (uracil1498-N3)-methyltransferase